MQFRHALIATAAVSMTAALLSPPAAQAGDTCGPSAGGTLCLTVPDGPLSNIEPIIATWSGTGTATVEFTLDGAYLNDEYQKPYAFSWPTDKELDGVYTVAARVHKGSTYGSWVSADVTLANGNITSIPRNPADYGSLFVPNGTDTIAAVGNAGAEKQQEKILLNYIESTIPEAFLYLGEVHEYGTWATRLDHYGMASFDAINGSPGTLWGRMARYTLPTMGNHERGYVTEFRDYWHQRPLWSTEVLNGVRVYDLTSECKANGGCLAKGQQARWLASQLATNNEPCVLSFWHRPVVSMDSKRSGPTMQTIWTMLANNGGDLVLNADTREMEEVRPMNAALQTAQPDSHMVELISGAAAARWVISNTSDPRVAWHLYRVPGAVFVHSDGQNLQWEFRNSSGTVLRSGSVSC